MVIRESYLQRIRPFYEQHLIKVITGVRRSGKSVLLGQIRDDLIAQGADEAQIVSINFELMDNKPLRSADALHAYLKERMNSKKPFILLDEVQLVDGFEEVVNSLQASGASVFITGSNSKLLSGELATLLSGRYVAFQMMPFSFREYSRYIDERTPQGLNYPHDYPHDYSAAIPPDQKLRDYLRWGGFPLVCEQSTDESRIVVLNDLYASIVLKDIMDRNDVPKGAPLQNVLDFLIASSANLISGKKVADTLTSNNMRISAPTVYDYLRFIQDAYVVSLVERYDIDGKAALRYEKKAFACDLGLFHIKKSRTKDELSRVIETAVYNELVSRGYQVYVGKTRKGEIDFVVMRGDERCYIQVAYLMQDEATIEREFGAFKQIPDAYPRYVISMDPLTADQDGIKHLRLIDFLSDGTTLDLG